MRFLVATDYDGTLNQNGEISPQNVAAIKKFRSKGHLFGIVTGRDYPLGFKVFKEENLFEFDFIIMCNGAETCDADGNILFSHFINGPVNLKNSTFAKKLIKRCLELTSNCCRISLEKKRYNFHPEHLNGATISNVEYSSISVLENINNFISASAVCDTFEQANQITEILKKEFGEYINPLRNGKYIDISPAGIDKSTGIENYASYMNIRKENIYAAGDNYNDISMLKKYHGCAMSRGVKEISEIAEYTCDSVADVISMLLEQ